MRNEPILVVMAAGIGSRFGGLKQLAAFGSRGEGIIDYSLFDAYRAGFRRVVFIVSDAIHEEFREKIGLHAEGRMETRYAVQRLETLPAGCTVPAGRAKPWGTGHAVMCARDFIDAPFCAINGDDFYGADAFQKMFDYLNAAPAEGAYAMAGFRLKNTLSENGYVSRGVCGVDEQGKLQSVVERTHIISTCDGPMFTLDGNTYERLDENTTVSMNLWGFTPGFMNALWERFPAFYQTAMASNPLKAEFYLPFAVNDMLRDGLASARVLHTDSVWYGVTYHDDLPAVKAAIDGMTARGEYPAGLWE